MATQASENQTGPFQATDATDPEGLLPGHGARDLDRAGNDQRDPCTAKEFRQIHPGTRSPGQIPVGVPAVASR